jgi:ABC-type multidrug transport system ATPase subunit
VPDHALRLSGVSWWFRRGVPILDGIDFVLARGECVVVRGPNGSGKTTLARLAAGALIAKRGSAHRTGPVGYVPQASDDPPLRLRASGLLDAIGRMRGARRNDDVIDGLGLRSYVTRPLTELSTGTVVKVLIAGALIGSPRFLVCDEPFADLDDQARSVVGELLTRVRAEGCAVLLTDHSTSARPFADREVEVSAGKLVERGA